MRNPNATSEQFRGGLRVLIEEENDLLGNGAIFELLHVVLTLSISLSISCASTTTRSVKEEID